MSAGGGAGDVVRGAAPIALWLVPVADDGGVARHVVDVARQGIPGHRVVVLCPEGALARRLRAQGSAVTTGRFGTAAGLSASVRTLAATAGALRPAIVHSHLAHADLVSAATPLPRGVRRLTTEHGIAGPDAVYHRSGAQARAMALAHRARLHRFDGAIAVSQATRHAMREKWHAVLPVDVVLNGVDGPAADAPAAARRPRPSGALRVVSLSRLSPEKRIDALLEAFAVLHRRVPGATLTVAGEGPLDGALRARASALGLGDAVAFPGFVDSARMLAEADVVAQLSVWENCSYTLLDAVARGLGVVATAVGGNPEILAPRSLVDADDPAAVARALERQAEEPAAAAAPRSVARMCAGIADVYAGVCARSAA
ncbi:glycosyltransferase involved in cell wall biosynthesis [Rathayibacter sp. PhB93]|uniref:glycosyltransferase family 4 protein n=1 Tax=unclassified Rathayibacter TaxID=2609250 RepID=UPI000F9EB4CC|nr:MULTISPECIES: glycosyltransferase family 4 protein [unclassified Rathayibacter]ROQ15537.1 glycosyltransferase involved in cell wall biosynthesis [Rathayibacter sp. PhB93]TDQ15475.1 glycosyltransferase involved in cell wall biosynthesis [Rathayibacter sp. PhB1]